MFPHIQQLLAIRYDGIPENAGGEDQGYLPYKPFYRKELPVVPAGFLEQEDLYYWKRDFASELVDEARRKVDVVPTSGNEIQSQCQQGKKNCGNLGHPEICCKNEHTCLPTNNTLTGVYCCPSSDPSAQPCSDATLSCDSGWYECSAEFNGGCCKVGQSCGLQQCYASDDPSFGANSEASSGVTSFIPDLNGDGLTGKDDPNEIPRTTITYTGVEGVLTVIQITPPEPGWRTETDDVLSYYENVAFTSTTTSSAIVTGKAIPTAQGSVPTLGTGTPLESGPSPTSVKMASGIERLQCGGLFRWRGALTVVKFLAVIAFSEIMGMALI
ncbi:hypothetical protein RUND412_002469 [Rhizina undulata]